MPVSQPVQAQLVSSELLPAGTADGTEAPARGSRYRDIFTMPVMRKQHVLALEGSYYVANNAQTAIAPTYGTSFSATVGPFVAIINGHATQRLFLDYIALSTVVAGTCTTTVGYIAAAVYIDNINRYTSGGTNLTTSVVCPNMAAGANNSAASVYCGAITAPAASGAVRAVCGVRVLRPCVSSTVIGIVGDMYLLTFGSVEGNVGSITVANANLCAQAFPPIILGPGHSALLYIWYPVMTAPTAATYAPEIGFWMR